MLDNANTLTDCLTPNAVAPRLQSINHFETTKNLYRSASNHSGGTRGASAPKSGGGDIMVARVGGGTHNTAPSLNRSNSQSNCRRPATATRLR